MNLQILNSDLSLHGIATGFESVEFTRAFNTKGNFKIKINANNQNAKYIKIDKIVYIDEDKIGYIDKVTIDRKSDKAGEYIIAEGVELKDRLNRLIYPDSGLESDSYTGEYLETIIKSLIQKNASGSERLGGAGIAAESRQIPNLIVASNQNRGKAIDYSAYYKDLSTELYSLLSSQEMGLKATIDFDNTNIIFDVAVGEDLKASEGQKGGIILSLDTKTALSIVDTDDKLSYKNLSVTAGLGEGADRTIKEVFPGDEEEDEPAGYERREVFTNAKDIESDDELPTRGAQKLAEISKTRAITAKANALGTYQIGVDADYDLGDYISIDANGDLFDAQVTKLKYKFSKESVPEIEVVLNFDTDDTLTSDISAKNMDYNSLVASSSSSGGMTLLDSYEVTGSAETSIDFTGLNIATGDVIQLICDIEIGATGSFYIFVNGDTTVTNYYTQRLAIYTGTDTSASRDNIPQVTYGYIDGSSSFEIGLRLTNTGRIIAKSSVIRDYNPASVIKMEERRIAATFTATSITQISIASAVTGGIGVNSKIWLYKLN